MEFPQTRRRRVVFLTGYSIALGLATTISIQLAAYGVPTTLIAACGLGVASAGLHVFERLTAAASTTTYLCPSKGCDFKVTLTNVDAAEDRRWQEIATAHPHRYQR